MIYHQYKNKIDFVAAELRKKILSGEISPEQRLATSMEIAHEYGVSMMTADHALKQLVDEGLIVRTKGQGTRILPARKKFTIALLDNKTGALSRKDQVIYEQNTYPIITRECAARGMQLQHVYSLNSPIGRKADGILTSVNLNPSNLPKVPIAYFRDYRMIDRPFIQVVPDLTSVMNEIFRSITDKLDRQYYISMTGNTNIRLFGEKFIMFAKHHGIPSSSMYISIESSNKDMTADQIGYNFGKEIPDPRNAVIFSTSDFRSAGILRALDERGVPPEEYDLISCNNWESYGFNPFPVPRMTSIDFRREDMFIKLIEMLYNAIAHKENNFINIAKIPAVLKIRQSAFSRRVKQHESNASPEGAWL